MRPFLLLCLPLPEHRRKYEQAAFEITALMEGTASVMVAFRQGPDGPVPIELAEIEETNKTDAGEVLFIGYILGPEVKDATLAVEETWWGREVLRLLMENGLEAGIKEQVN